MEIPHNFNFQMVIIIVGTLGLVLALLALIFRRSRISDASEKTPSSPLPPAKSAWWNALAKTRARFFFGASSEIAALREAMEEACITSDLGVANTTEAMSAINWTDIAAAPAERRVDLAKSGLATVVCGWVSAGGVAQANPNEISSSHGWPRKIEQPTVIWFVGVNGVGKTTSIAKFAAELKGRGFSVMLAAGDTFRAAASEQLETWASRLEVPCVRGQLGGDSSAVLFDAIQSAKAKKIDFLLCDSAGRLHNQSQLMDALAKNKRAMAKVLPSAPHEVLLVLDANTGQNMLSQADHFLSSVGVTGLILTKLDGTARGGAVVAVARKTSLPIRRLGLGEAMADFTAFEARPFADALLGVE